MRYNPERKSKFSNDEIKTINEALLYRSQSGIKSSTLDVAALFGISKPTLYRRAENAGFYPVIQFVRIQKPTNPIEWAAKGSHDLSILEGRGNI